MKKLWMAALAALCVSTFTVGTAFAQACSRGDAQQDQGEIWRGDVCEQGALGSDMHAICGRDFRLLVPYTGQDAVFNWVVPETGRWDIKGSGSGLNALQISEDPSLSCAALSRLLPMNNGNSQCSTGSNIGFDAQYLEKGQELVVIADSKPGTCGEAVIEATLTQSCTTNVEDLGSEVGKIVTRHGTGSEDSTQIVRTSCGGNSLPFGQREYTEQLNERIYKWTAPAAGTYNFLAESAGNGVTMAIMEDGGLCPEVGDSHHDKCQTIDSGVGAPVSRTITLRDMAEDETVLVVMKQRGLERPITFDLSISEDVCTTTEVVSDMVIDSRGTNPNVTGLVEGDVHEGPSCATTNMETKHIVWEAPYSGTFSFESDSAPFRARVAFEVRAGACDGESLGCSVPDDGGVTDVSLEKGEQVVISIGRVNNVGSNYTINVTGVGCGDGVINGDEECDFADVDTALVCPDGFDLGTPTCTESCELDTRDCLGECEDTTSCEERAGSERHCNAQGDCFYTCEDGFLDCDGDLNVEQGEASNGCESEINSATSCGECGQQCGDEQVCEEAVGAGMWSCTGDTTCYVDEDGDGFGVDETGVPTNGNCPAGTVPFGGDCDDTNPSVHPGAAEICNGIDDNCNGEIDEDNDDICPSVEGAVGVCEATSGETPRCEFSCEGDLIPIDGDAQNGCSVDGSDPGDNGDGNGNGNGGDIDEIPSDEVSLGGGRFFGACSSTSTTGMTPALLALLGLALLGRARRRTA